jgi:hypothetical protein
MNRNVPFPVAGGMTIVVDLVEVIIVEDKDDDDECWDEVVVVEDKDDDDDCSEEEIVAEDIVAEDDSDDDGWDKEGTKKEIDMKAAVTINNITTTASKIRLINHNAPTEVESASLFRS